MCAVACALSHVRCSAGEAIQVLQRRRRGNVKSPCRIFHHQHFGIKVKIKRTARFCFLHGSFFQCFAEAAAAVRL